VKQGKETAQAKDSVGHQGTSPSQLQSHADLVHHGNAREEQQIPHNARASQQ
jgi:hypothetical protein